MYLYLNLQYHLAPSIGQELRSQSLYGQGHRKLYVTYLIGTQYSAIQTGNIRT